jgi:hypothetical protein
MPRLSKFDPTVLTRKTVFLQRLQEAVGDGYRYYCAGTISVRKSPGLMRKFKEMYFVHLDKNARYRRKSAGMGNARVILRFTEEQQVDFFLLVSPGFHPAHQLEKLHDAGERKLAYQEFELVPLTLKGRSKPSLTWRLDAETMQSWRQRLHLYTAHYNRLELFRAWFSLYRTPGFGGIRQQVGQLVGYWRSEWRQHRGDAPCPVSYSHDDLAYRTRPGISKKEDGMYWTALGFPMSAQLPKLFYVRKQADFGVRLSKLLKEEDAEATNRNPAFARA